MSWLLEASRENDSLVQDQREMEDSVAATEMSVVEGERHELHG